MQKISTAEQKKHQQAKEILKKDILTFEEKVFVYENYNEGAENLNGLVGAFFTPMELANDFKLEVQGNKIVDLCAGIGILAFNFLHGYNHAEQPEITCIEINPTYVEIGKKLLPEATWICGDLMDSDLLGSLDYFDCAIGNPPFGNIKCNSNHYLKYQGKNFEYKIIEIGSYIAKSGAFIVPQESAPFAYSGRPIYEVKKSSKYIAFESAIQLELEAGTPVDTSIAKGRWKGTNPDVEIVIFMNDYRPNNPFKNIGHQTQLFA